jgi:D-glycero-alpha-D-manno-heptose-7-phosphate kinase
MLVRSKAPLRLGIAGGGSDVSPYCDTYGGYVLNAAIDMYAYCTVESWNLDQIVFIATDRGESYVAETTSYIPLDGMLDLHKAIYNQVIKRFNQGEPLAFKMTTYSDAPAGSGLGSSSTMVVAILKAFVEWLRLPLGEYEIAHLAYEIERLEVGLSGGRQDTYAATFGGFNFIEFYAQERVIVNPLRIKNWMINELESSMVLYYMATSRESAKIIDEQVKNIKCQNQQAIEATHEIKNDAIRMKEAILKGNLPEIAQVLGKSWEAKKKLADGISNERIDQIYNLALKAGAYSGKISGAGGGGFIIFMVDPIKKIAVNKVLEELGGRVSNFHFTKYGTQAWTI